MSIQWILIWALKFVRVFRQAASFKDKLNTPDELLLDYLLLAADICGSCIWVPMNFSLVASRAVQTYFVEFLCLARSILQCKLLLRTSS